MSRAIGGGVGSSRRRSKSGDVDRYRLSATRISLYVVAPLLLWTGIFKVVAALV